jgi:RND family efflux transporter MFP subunit
MRNSRLSLMASRVAACFAVFTCVTSGWSETARAADAADGGSVAVQTVPVHLAPLAQPVRGYGIVGAAAANVTTLDLPYLARIAQLRVQAGQTVTRGTPLVVVLADPAAVLAAAQARNTATLAQGELARTQSLYDQELATQSQLAAARKALTDAQQALAAQDQMGVHDGSKIITAPFDGVVLQVSVAQGDQVLAGAPILQLAAADTGKDARANVMLGVEPAASAAIHTGDAVILRGLSTALAGQAVTGRVVMVGGSVDPQSQLVNVGANVPLGKTALIPGTRVSADIATLGATYWVVPRSSVLKDDKGEYVFQVAPDHKAHRVSVDTKVENGERYGVEGALDASRPLVVSGNYELKDGMAVRTGGGAAP